MRQRCEKHVYSVYSILIPLPSVPRLVSIFGAVLYGDFQDVTPKDRIKIALAGPLCNVALCVVCLALCAKLVLT